MNRHNKNEFFFSHISWTSKTNFAIRMNFFLFYNLKFGRNRSNSEKAYWVALKNHKMTWSTEAAKAELKFCVFFSENKSTVCKFATTASLATRIRTHRLSQIPQCASYCGAESNSKMCIIQRSQTSRCTSHRRVKKTKCLKILCKDCFHGVNHT